MAPGRSDRQTDPNDEALDAVRAALPGPGDEDLVEHRPEDPSSHRICGHCTTRWGSDDAGS